MINRYHKEAEASASSVPQEIVILDDSSADESGGDDIVLIGESTSGPSPCSSDDGASSFVSVR